MLSRQKNILGTDQSYSTPDGILSYDGISVVLAWRPSQPSNRFGLMISMECQCIVSREAGSPETN